MSDPAPCRCSPLLPPGAAGRRRRALGLLTGRWAVAYFAGVALLLEVAPHLGRRGDLGLVGLASLAGATWCGLNFRRCRQAHCAVTAPGWLGLGALALVEAALGRSLIGGREQLAFLGVLAAALGFEAVWRRARGTCVLGR